jgi:hypothetical protein
VWALWAVTGVLAVGVGLLAWRHAVARGELRLALRVVDELRGELTALQTQMAAWVASVAEERQRTTEAHQALMGAVSHAHDEMREALSHPGVPQHLAGEYAMRVLNQSPDVPDGGDGKRGLPPLTRPPARTAPGGSGRGRK